MTECSAANRVNFGTGAPGKPKAPKIESSWYSDLIDAIDIDHPKDYTVSVSKPQGKMKEVAVFNAYGECFTTVKDVMVYSNYLTYSGGGYHENIIAISQNGEVFVPEEAKIGGKTYFVLVDTKQRLNQKNLQNVKTQLKDSGKKSATIKDLDHYSERPWKYAARKGPIHDTKFTPQEVRDLNNTKEKAEQESVFK